MADLIDVSLSLNEEQFTRLKKELVDARPPFWKSEALLRTVQILAIVVGGCWVLIQFLLYERGKIELETKKVTAEIEESELRAQLNEIKKEKDKFNLTSLKTYRVDYSQDIQVEYLEKLDDVYSLFKLTADFKIKNTSKTEFELSLWVLDY